MVLSGVVFDDAERSLVGTRVHIALARAAEPLATISPALGAPEPCRGGPPEVSIGQDLVVPTDEAGRFCTRLALATDRYVVRIKPEDTEFVDGTALALTLDLAAAQITLRFDPERYAFSLDDDTTSLDVMASTEDDGVTTFAPGLVVSLSNEAGVRLGEATTDVAGRARFTFDSAHLGPPRASGGYRRGFVRRRE